MPITTEAGWRRLLIWLRRNFPEGTGRKISVRRVPNKKMYRLAGDTDNGSSSFIIRINANMWFDMTVDTLLHEWAHALTWFNDEEPHSDVWGVTHAKILREYYYWGFGRKKKEE